MSSSPPKSPLEVWYLVGSSSPRLPPPSSLSHTHGRNTSSEAPGVRGGLGSMGVPSAAGSWDAEDDFLLKNAVEAGSSLESLAKGAICFSRKFTLQELQDRWCSLLYDSETSAQASARIVEFETVLSTSSPGKTIKRFNSKGKVYSGRKRKIDSVKYQYYSRRKRVCHEPCLSTAFRYDVPPCSCTPDGSGCVCGGLLKPLEGHHLAHTLDPAALLVDNYGHIDDGYGGGQNVHHKDNQNYLFHANHANAAGSILKDGTVNDDILHGCSDVGQPYKCGDVQKNPQSSERNIAPLKDLPDLQDYVNPQQPLLGVQYGNGVTGSEILLDADRNGVKQNQFSESSQQLCSGIPMIHAWSKSEDVKSADMLVDMHKNEEHITFFCDKKMETFSSDTFASLVNGISDSGLDNASLSENESMHACSMNCSQSKDSELLNGKNISGSALDTAQDDFSDFSAKVVMEDISRVHLLGLSDSHSSNTCDSHIYPIHKNHYTRDVYGTDMVAISSEVPFSGCSIQCRMNTEDSEIPCNDDALMHDQVSDEINCKFLADKPNISCEAAIRNCMSSHGLPDMEFHNPIASMSSSDQAEGGSDNENYVPNYFDIEALILNQDLIPWDQESDFIQPEVSRFQHLKSRKDLIRLEQGARSYMNRSIMSQGAFAIIYGRYLKYYIKDPEVTLGRETEEVHVDIDLAKEGNANKISRRQAVIKMDEVGSFHIKNIGKYPIFVNGKEVPRNKRINLISDALLEIRGMNFIFHVNPEAVRQHIIHTRRSGV
ncbi:uncharacterized protein [Lolium perenne]|uniref:uncharacterized protein isoform X3 n=1 Tax=Lolium perenne TaxID=4522 RepID=UPI0021F63762|nr:uncharacterized protein LOC127321983 isoform X3 [Lolium perenne]